MAWNNTEDSVSRHVVTANDNAQIDTAQYKFGGASGLFDGTGDYVSVPDSDDFNFGSGDFTIDMWVRWNGTPGNTGLCGQSDGGHGNLKWAIYWNAVSANNLTFHMQNPAGTTINVHFSWTPSGDTWYHLAMSRSGSSWYFFVDGTQTGGTQTESTAFPNVSSDLRVGSGGEDWQYHNGWIDEFRISKGVARYTSSFTPATSAYEDDSYTTLLLHMDGTDASTRFIDSAKPADGADVTLWPDNSTNENDAEQTNASYKPTYVTDAVNGYDAIEGDGSSQQMQLPNLDTNTFSFFMVVKWASVGVSGDMMISNDNNGWGICFRSDNKIELTKTGVSVVASTGTVSDTSWHLVTVIYDGSNAYFRVDGVDIGSPGYSVTFDSGGGSYTLMGRGNAEWLSGRIADYAVYDNAVSDADRDDLESYFIDKYLLPYSSSSSSSNSTSFSSSSSNSTSFSSSSSNSTSFSSSSSNSTSLSSSSSNSTSLSSSSSESASLSSSSSGGIGGDLDGGDANASATKVVDGGDANQVVTNTYDGGGAA